MYDSTLILSRLGSILKMDIDVNETLVEPGVDYLYKNFTSLFNSSQTELLKNFVEKAFQTEKLQCIEFFHSKNFYQLKCIVVQPGQAVCIITNNTRQGQLLNDIEAHNMKTIVDNYGCVWSFDTNLTLVTANKRYLDMRRRINKKEIRIGDNVFKNSGEHSFKKWLPILERALKGETINIEEKRNSDEGEFFIEIYISPVYNEAGEVIGGLGFTRDITERKMAQIAIAGYTEQLEKFAIKTSHELRRPIANILGMANLLRFEEMDAVDMSQTMSYMSVSINELDAIAISMVRLMEQQKLIPYN